MTDLFDIKDPAVAIHLAKLEGKIESLKTSSDHLGKQLEAVITELREVTKVSMRYNDHDEKIKRVWIELDERDAHCENRLMGFNEALSKTTSKVDRIFWFSAGASFVGTALISLIIWTVVGNFEKTKDLDKRVNVLEQKRAA